MLSTGEASSGKGDSPGGVAGESLSSSEGGLSPATTRSFEGLYGRSLPSPLLEEAGQEGRREEGRVCWEMRACSRSSRLG